MNKKKAGKILNEYLGKWLKKVGFKQSRFDECLFYKDNMLFFLNFNDGIFLASTEISIKTTVQDLIVIWFDLEYQCTLYDYLGVNLEDFPDGKIKVTLPQKKVGISQRMDGKLTPVV